MDLLVAALQCCSCSYYATIWQVVSQRTRILHGSINCYHRNSCFDLKMQFTNHLSAGLCPDLLGELTELGWLDPLAGCEAPRETEEKRTRMKKGNVEGKGG